MFALALGTTDPSFVTLVAVVICEDLNANQQDASRTLPASEAKSRGGGGGGGAPVEHNVSGNMSVDPQRA